MTVSADEFMRAAFSGIDVNKELPVISCARLNKDKQWGFPAEPYAPGHIQSGEPWYFNITTYRPPQDGGRFLARLPLAVSTRVIVLDDIGDHEKSKVSWQTFDARAPVPHYILATREDEGRANCQIGYFMESTDPHEASTLIKALIKAGLTDPGMRSSNRWARLPGSIKHGGIFSARLLDWAPPRRSA